MDTSSEIRRVVATYGLFRVEFDPLSHRPYGLFRVYVGDRYVGAQISWVTAQDCRWLKQHQGVYATVSRYQTAEQTRGCYQYGNGSPLKKRGRPRKADADRELEEALKT